MTWPLITHLAEAIPGPPWDGYIYLWEIWWFKRAIVDLQTSPLWAPEVFYPGGYDLALAHTMLVDDLMALPFTLLWGEVVAYNLLFLLASTFSGWTTYLWVRSLLASQRTEGAGHNHAAFWAGMISGAIFTFGPYHVAAMVAGWPSSRTTLFLPLLFWAGDRLLARPDGRRGALLGLVFVLNALTSWYHAYMAVVFVPLYLWLRWDGWRQRLKTMALWRGLIAFAGLCLLLLGPYALRLASHWTQGAIVYSIRHVDRWSASLEDFVLPSLFHPLWGEWVAALRPEQPLYPWYVPGVTGVGFVALVLIAFGLRRLWWRDRTVRALLGVAVVAGIFALGMTLHIGGQTFYLPVPSIVAKAFNYGMSVLVRDLALNPVSYFGLITGDAIVIPMPTLLIYLFVPASNSMRLWYRFGLITLLAVAVLAGVAFWRMAGGNGETDQGSPGTRRAAPLMHPWWGAVIFLLVLVEFLAAPATYGRTEIWPQPVERWLAAQPDGAVALFPIGRALTGEALYGQRWHGKPMIYGYGTFLPQQFRQERPVLERFPEADAIAILRQDRVRYLLVDQAAYGENWPEVQAQLAQTPGVRLAGRFPKQPVFVGDQVLTRLRNTEMRFPPGEVWAYWLD